MGPPGGFFRFIKKTNQKLSYGSETGFGEMFEGEFADTCANTFLLMLMGGQAEGLVCADPVARTSIGVSGNV